MIEMRLLETLERRSGADGVACSRSFGPGGGEVGDGGQYVGGGVVDASLRDFEEKVCVCVVCVCVLCVYARAVHRRTEACRRSHSCILVREHVSVGEYIL